MLVLLRVVLSLILLSMVALTLVAFQESSLMEAGSELWKDAWFRLTLADAYLGFLIVYLWVAYIECERGTWLRRYCCEPMSNGFISEGGARHITDPAYI